MKKIAAQLMGIGLVLGMGVSPVIAQDSGIANTAEDFQSADDQGGFLGSGTDIWDLFHNARSLSGATFDEGFMRTQDRRINSQAESFRQRQQELLNQMATEEATPAAEADVVE
ncbi:MAG: hypothetical protein AAFQ74_12220 [Cyanobacteria bacterium J06623_4]